MGRPRKPRNWRESLWQAFLRRLSDRRRKKVRRAVNKWHALPLFRRMFVLNLAIGLVVVGAIQAFHWMPTIQAMQEDAMDWMISIQAGTRPPKPQQRPYVFLNYDEVTHQRLGEPLVTPRHTVAQLLEQSINAKARLILVDIDLSRAAFATDDLARVLAPYRQGEPDLPHIIFARSLRPVLDPNSPVQFEARASFLDETVSVAPRLHWATTRFLRDPDMTVRRWALWHVVCADDKPRVIPAMQLLSASLILGGEDNADLLNKRLQFLAPSKLCTDASVTLRTDHRAVHRMGDISVHLFQDQLSSRIIYDIPWNPDNGAVPQIAHQGRNVPALINIPAHILLGSGEPVSREIFEGRIVVIGGSHSRSNDLHLTPIGIMPGAVILANATYSLIQAGDVQPPPWWIIILVQLGVVLVFALVFAWINTPFASFVAGTILIGALLPLSFYIFREGIWLDFALPILALQVHHMVSRGD